MARRRISNFRPGALLLAFLIACFFWAVSQGQTDTEQVFAIPIELREIPDALVITEQNVDAITVNVRGTPAALRNLDPDQLTFPINLSRSNRGVTTVNVPNPPVDLPRGVKPLSLSPSQVTIRLERKGRKSVLVRADIEGEPAEGFRLKELRVVPSRVWLAGARSQVQRLEEVVTEPIDLTSLEEGLEREVRLFLGGGTVWKETDEPVKVVIEIEPIPVEGEDGEETAPG
jgi:YbbR domain-containing protein